MAAHMRTMHMSMKNCMLATFSLEQKRKSILETLDFRFERLAKGHCTERWALEKNSEVTPENALVKSTV